MGRGAGIRHGGDLERSRRAVHAGRRAGDGIRARASGGSETRWGRSARATTTSKCRTLPSLRRGTPRLRAAHRRRRRQHPLRLARPRAPGRHRLPRGDGDRRPATASRCPTVNWPARRSTRRSASGTSARCGRRSTVPWPTARSSRTSPARRSAASPARLALLYDVSHNTCKVERHVVDGEPKNCSCTARARRARSARAIPICPRHFRDGPAGADRRQHGHGSYVLAGTDESDARASLLLPVTARAAP